MTTENPAIPTLMEAAIAAFDKLCLARRAATRAADFHAAARRQEEDAVTQFVRAKAALDRALFNEPAHTDA